MGSILAAAGLALGLLLASATTAAAEDWIPSGYAHGGTYFTDLASLSRQGDVVRSWMREDLPRPARGATGASYSHTFTERYDDCARRRFSFTGSVRRNDRGDVVETYSNPGDWHDIVPGSIAESVWRTACAATSPPKDKPLVQDLGAGTWTLLGASADKRYVLYAAFDRVVRLDAQHLFVLTRSDFAKPQWIGGLPIRYVVTASVIDCTNRKTAEGGLDMLLSPAIRVRSVRVASVAELKFDSPPPGSFAFASLDRFCSAPTVPVAGEADQDDGDVVSGTAWLATKGYLVTADHVVAGAKMLTIYSNGEAVGRAEIVAEDSANDLAILKPIGWTTRRRLALPLAAHGAALGRRVFTLGYPEPDTLGQRLKMTSGEVSGTTGPRDDAHDLQISVPIQPGNSGGPVLTWDGAVIGIVDYKLKDFAGADDEQKPELVNYAVKVAYLRPMLDDLPDLGDYQLLESKGRRDDLVAKVGPSVFMVVAAH